MKRRAIPRTDEDDVCCLVTAVASRPRSAGDDHVDDLVVRLDVSAAAAAAVDVADCCCTTDAHHHRCRRDDGQTVRDAASSIVQTC